MFDFIAVIVALSCLALVTLAAVNRFPRAIYTTMFWNTPPHRDGKGTVLVIEMGADRSFPQLWRSVGGFVNRHSSLNIRVLPFREVTASGIGMISPQAMVMTGYHQVLSLYRMEEMENLFDFLRHTRIPVFAICGGFQFLCRAFGSGIVEMGFHERGYVAVTVLRDDKIFHGLPGKFIVYNRHQLTINRIPDEFEKLAENESCIQVVRHRMRLIYGVQFHPEFSDDHHPHGVIIFKNFLYLAGIVTQSS